TRDDDSGQPRRKHDRQAADARAGRLRALDQRNHVLEVDGLELAEVADHPWRCELEARAQIDDILDEAAVQGAPQDHPRERWARAPDHVAIADEAVPDRRREERIRAVELDHRGLLDCPGCSVEVASFAWIVRCAIAHPIRRPRYAGRT